MFLVALVSYFVCGQHYSKRYERIGIKFYGGHFYTGQYMRVMICLNQGGLRSLSASSLFVCLSVDNITQNVMNELG